MEHETQAPLPVQDAEPLTTAPEAEDAIVPDDAAGLENGSGQTAAAEGEAPSGEAEAKPDSAAASALVPPEPGETPDAADAAAPAQAPNAEAAPEGPDADKRYQNKYAAQYRAELDLMPEGMEKNYLLDRVFPQMKYYSDSSRVCKKMYHRLTILCLIFNGLVPFLILLEDVAYVGPFMKYLVAALSSAAGILTAVLALKKHRELWVQYRLCLEQLKRTVNMYFMNAGEFANLTDDPEKRKQALFTVCENISIGEHNQWAALEQKDDKKEDK